MIYYITPIVIGFLLSFFEFKFNDYYIKTPVTKRLFVFISAIIFCGGYMTGSDWVNYELLYNDASFIGLKYYPKEKGFYLLMLIFKKIGLGFFPFLIICKLFAFTVLAKFISNNFKSFYLPFTIFLASDALFLFIDNPLRFMIAFGIIVISYKYLLNRRFIPYLLLVVLASTIHISSAIMLLLYFSFLIKTYNKYISILIYFFAFVLLSPDLVLVFIERLIPSLKILIHYYLDKMVTEEIQLFSIGRIIYLLFFIIVVLNRDKILKHKETGTKIYQFTIAMFYLMILGWIIPTFFRLSLFLIPFLYISLSIIILTKSKLQIFLKLFFVLYFTLSTVKEIYSTYVYIPYSNYFTSLLVKEQSFSYRANYNKEMYFKRTGSWPTYD